MITALVFNAAVYAAPDRPYPLMVGDPAPPLAVSAWVKGEPVPAFKRGHVYVIDFWATWCPPCIESIPGLTELQKKHAGKVTFIGVDVWDYQDRVKPFVEKMGEKMDYRIAIDDVPPVPEGTKNVPLFGQQNGKVSKAWMNASGWSESGIPTIFVVDKEGLIAWIGDDLKTLDSVLGQVSSGSYDLAAKTAEYAKEAALLKTKRNIQKELRDAINAKDWSKALVHADALIAMDPEHADLAGFKFQTLYLPLKDRAAALRFAREQLKVNKDPSAFGQMAYVIVFMGGSELTAEELEVGELVASRAIELSEGERPGPLESLARIAFLRGDKAKAVDIQKRAIALIKNENALKEAEKRLAEYGGSVA